MGKNHQLACRLCRREGMKLFLKGERCNMAKCPIELERGVPGMHGTRRTRKESDYSRQFREKQRLKRFYGLREHQFKRFFEQAAKHHGVTGEVLLQMLEMRLDNLVYRFGFAASRRAARQFVLHRHIIVNNKRADIPSMLFKAGDRIEVKNNEASRQAAKRCLERTEDKPLSPWLSLDRSNFTGEILRIPSKEEIAPLVDEQLVVELSSK